MLRCIWRNIYIC